MAYLDPKPMSPARIWSIAVVLLIHGLLLYALINGGYSVVKETLAELDVIEIAPEPPPELPDLPPPPPPPDKALPPPPVVPPVRVQTQAPVQNTIVSTPIPQPPAPVYVAPPAPVPAPPAPPPAPPAPPAIAQKAVLRGGSITDDDYPPAAVRAEEQGRSVATFTIGTDGRVTTCNASGAGPILDAETCKLILRRFRFKPAQATGGTPVAETKTQSIVWRLPT